MKSMIAIIAAFSIPAVVIAQTSAGHDTHHSTEIKVAQTASALADGEVRRIDKDAQKMTIKHGPIPSLDMPPMTMVYRVKDPAMLDQVKPGDKIKFTADKVGGGYTVTTIETAK